MNTQFYSTSTPAYAIRPFAAVHARERACVLYNRLTNPAAMRTDDEHARCRKAARKVYAYAFKLGRVAESESGRLYPF